MYVLTLRTDNPQAEIGIFDDTKQLAYEKWQAHRELSDTIHLKLAAILKTSNLNLHQLQAIVVYRGPGSFTGLRIGITLANTLAYAQQLPIIGSMDETWLERGIEQLITGENDVRVLPEYGAEPNITKPKH